MEQEANVVSMGSHCLGQPLPWQRGAGPPLQRCWLDPDSFGFEGGVEDGLRGAPLLLTRG